MLMINYNGIVSIYIIIYNTTIWTINVFNINGSAEIDLVIYREGSVEKSIEMIHQKELLPLTGYIHGGCSPIGMKKKFTTVIDETAQLFDFIFVSAGRVGFQVKINPLELQNYVDAQFIDLIE